MKLNKFLTLTAMIALFLLPGCKSDDEPIIGAVKSHQMVRFMIQMSTESDGTRAGADAPDPNDYTDPDKKWEDQYNTGEASDFDNLIKNIEPMLFLTKKEDGKPVVDVDKPFGNLTIIENGIEPVGNSGNTYKVTALLETPVIAEELKKLDLRFVVFANVSKKGLSSNNPNLVCFERHGIPGTIEEKIPFDAIPMFGIGKPNFDGLTSANHSDTEPFDLMDGDDPTQDLSISLLRSMAKICVKLDDAKINAAGDRDVKLVSLNIDRHSRKGFVAPKGWAKVTSVKKLGLKSVLNPYIDSQRDYRDDCNVIINDEKDKNTSNKRLIFYVPETYNSQNDGYDTTPIKIEVKYTCNCGDCSTTDPHTNYLYFCTTNNGAHDDDKHGADTHNQWDIIRNHIYEFNITGIADNFNLECEVNVKKWGYHAINGVELGDDGKNQNK
ncbi:MAG: hypothetical protein K2N05_11365 [Muribaculaceae bacterium]|nr:hypothetical protein [Muribaculaceae bacterium]